MSTVARNLFSVTLLHVKPGMAWLKPVEAFVSFESGRVDGLEEQGGAQHYVTVGRVSMWWLGSQYSTPQGNAIHQWFGQQQDRDYYR